MKEKDKITVDITKDEITHSLSKCIKHDSAKLLAETIIGIASTTEIGLELIYKAMQGWERKFDFKVGQNILIPIENTYTWKMNKEATKNDPKYSKDGYIKAVITGIDAYARECYRLSYSYVDDKGEEHTQTDYTLDGRVFLLPDDFPFSE
jgi:hypothetical protein